LIPHVAESSKELNEDSYQNNRAIAYVSPVTEITPIDTETPLHATKIVKRYKVASKIESPVTSQIKGSKEEWLKSSGIPESQWKTVDHLIQKESGWNPQAVNKHSGACGLGQQLPCGKWPNKWNDPVGALQDSHVYVTARYGSWDNALAHHKRKNWY
jgi:hypothetical protein